MTFEDRLREIGQRNRDNHTAAYRERVKRTNAALGIRAQATPGEVHEAILRKTKSN